MTRHIQWAKRPESIQREEERMERENAIHVVRVIYDPLLDEAIIYRKGRMSLKHQDLSPSQKQIMLGAGEDERVFFNARWSREEVKWELMERVTADIGW